MKISAFWMHFVVLFVPAVGLCWTEGFQGLERWRRDLYLLEIWGFEYAFVEGHWGQGCQTWRHCGARTAAMVVEVWGSTCWQTSFATFCMFLECSSYIWHWEKTGSDNRSIDTRMYSLDLFGPGRAAVTSQQLQERWTCPPWRAAANSLRSWMESCMASSTLLVSCKTPCWWTSPGRNLRQSSSPSATG